MQEIVSVSSGGCFSLTNYPPVPGLVPNVPSSRNYQNGFASHSIDPNRDSACCLSGMVRIRFLGGYLLRLQLQA